MNSGLIRSKTPVASACYLPGMLRLGVAFLLLGILSPAVSAAPTPDSAAPLHTQTAWDLRPSLKYDAICLLNVLSGDPYYLQYYRAEYDHFAPLFTPGEQAAFRRLKQVIKDEGGGIVSADLALYLSAVDDETLEQMIHTTRDHSALEAALRRTPYWDPQAWVVFENIAPSLDTALGALQRVGFERWWETEVRPRIEKRIAEIAPALPRYNIVPAIERRLGFRLPSDRITVYLMAYSEPHGIRITGARFLTHVSYPFSIVLRNAIHEMMHPPFAAGRADVAAAIGRLGADPILREKIEHHDRALGYNDVAGYVEEDCVQALEAIIGEQFGVGRDQRAYWREQDGGIHVLAAAIYLNYKRELAPANTPMAFADWLVRAVDAGQLQGDALVEVEHTFLGASVPRPAPTTPRKTP